MTQIGYIKMVTIGSVNPNNPLSDQSREAQVALLNQCLNGYPKGIIKTYVGVEEKIKMHPRTQPNGTVISE